MNPEKWRQIDSLLQSALKLAPADRRAFLDQACASDQELRHELDIYLEAYEQGGEALDQLPRQLAARLTEEKTRPLGPGAAKEKPATPVSVGSGSDTLLVDRLASSPSELKPGVTLDGRYL